MGEVMVNNTELKFLKIVYFDETTAQDYLDITNGGRLDWSKEENKKRVAEILAQLEASVQGKFNILNFFKGNLGASADAKLEGELSKALETTLQNTLLTDYISATSNDSNVIKISNDGVYAPENSVSMYKMISSYLTIVPKEQMPIDMDKLNAAVLNERGYYGMLLKSEKIPAHLLRFNIKSFKNNYNLADLAKMKLTFWGIKVGECKVEELSIDKEFILQKEDQKITAEQIVNPGKQENDSENKLNVIDVVLAGVTNG